VSSLSLILLASLVDYKKSLRECSGELEDEYDEEEEDEQVERLSAISSESDALWCAFGASDNTPWLTLFTPFS